MRSTGQLALATLLAMGTSGCGEDTESVSPPPSFCEPPNRIVGDACIEPGVQDDGCPAGTLGLDDGSCRPAGIVAGECGEGFEHDGDVGCEPILPAESCPAGLMAVPGETACRPVMGCGSGTWGDISIDGQTQHVDQSFSGASDGTIAAPWTTVSEGVAAVPAGGLVAIAAGSYAEDVVVSQKPLRVHGVCPQQVEIVGIGEQPGALFIQSSQTEVRGIAIRGASVGVVLSGVQDVVLDQLHVHDNAGRGIVLQNNFGPTSATLLDSLVELNRQIGVFQGASTITIERSVVRDTLPGASGAGGISAQESPTTGEPSLTTVRGSLVERNIGEGVFVQASEATIEASVIRDSVSAGPGHLGRGINIQDSVDSGLPALVSVHTSVVERNSEDGLFVAGSEVTIESTVVRDTVVPPQSTSARALSIQHDVGATAPSIAVVRGSLLERSVEVGLFVTGSDVTIESTVVRSTMPDPSGTFGYGVAVQRNAVTGDPSHVMVRASQLTSHHSAGLFVTDSVVTVDGTLVTGTVPSDAGLFGDGLNAQFINTTPNLFVVASRIDDSTRAGVASFGATVSLGTTLVGCAAFPLNGESFNGSDFVFEDRGGNACACLGASGPCKSVSAGLEAPQPLPE
ncbi:MAG: hypothetical protein DRI90_05855 [Deltaproteobacteria bacterium]|nr:MAG: hypothetical protein DRI90_05855 [Deltaproteobacteria bacterium]